MSRNILSEVRKFIRNFCKNLQNFR